MAGHLFGTDANLGRPFLGAVPGSGRRPTATGAADLKEQCLLLERRACAGNEGISNSLFRGKKNCLHVFIQTPWRQQTRWLPVSRGEVALQKASVS